MRLLLVKVTATFLGATNAGLGYWQHTQGRHALAAFALGCAVLCALFLLVAREDD